MDGWSSIERQNSLGAWKEKSIKFKGLLVYFAYILTIYTYITSDHFFESYFNRITINCNYSKKKTYSSTELEIKYFTFYCETIIINTSDQTTRKLIVKGSTWSIIE